MLYGGYQQIKDNQLQTIYEWSGGEIPPNFVQHDRQNNTGKSSTCKYIAVVYPY